MLQCDLQHTQNITAMKKINITQQRRDMNNCAGGQYQMEITSFHF